MEMRLSHQTPFKDLINLDQRPHGTAVLISIRIPSDAQKGVSGLQVPSTLLEMIFARAFAVAVVFLTALVNAATYTGKVQVINGEGSSNGFLKNWNSGLWVVLLLTKALVDRPDSDGVDYTGNPLLVSISTNNTGPLNLIATVSFPGRGYSWC